MLLATSGDAVELGLIETVSHAADRDTVTQ